MEGAARRPVGDVQADLREVAQAFAASVGAPGAVE